MGKLNSISEMEPLMPEIGMKELEDLVSDFIGKANRLASQLKPQVIKSVGDLVRSMNCYYSNLIEGHDTHPRDIERALKEDFSSNKEKRNLQLEARSHITIQAKIDEGKVENITSAEYISWIHEEFYKLLPDELKVVENPDTKKIIKIIPGKFRTGNVKVGRHIAPKPESLESLLERFRESYEPKNLSKVKQVIAAAASHHRLLWIHPFYDGNGRVARLLSHSYLKHIGIGCSLWSISRGLARKANEYKLVLAEADNPRQGDLDGRGNLSEAGLSRFCKFFLECCIDQVDFMSSLLEPANLLKRIETYTDEQIKSGDLPKGSTSLLRYAMLNGEFERGMAPEISGYKDRQARTVLSTLLKRGLLVSGNKQEPVTLGFPSEVLDHWFPKLYIDFSIKIQTRDKLVDEFWTSALRYVMAQDPAFFKNEMKQYKNELDSLGKKQADKNQDKRIKEHIEKMSKKS
jgi:Fic family protein